MDPDYRLERRGRRPPYRVGRLLLKPFEQNPEPGWGFGMATPRIVVEAPRVGEDRRERDQRTGARRRRRTISAPLAGTPAWPRVLPASYSSAPLYFIT